MISVAATINSRLLFYDLCSFNYQKNNNIVGRITYIELSVDRKIMGDLRGCDNYVTDLGATQTIYFVGIIECQHDSMTTA